MLYLNGLLSADALQELSTSRAVGLGAAIALSGDKPEVTAAVRGLAGAAYPETYE